MYNCIVMYSQQNVVPSFITFFDFVFELYLFVYIDTFQDKITLFICVYRHLSRQDNFI